MNPEKTQKVRLQLENALTGAEIELAGIAAGKPSVSTKSELEYIVAKLREMLESLNTGTKVATAGLWHLVIDTWPLDDELGRQIVKAEADYERLK
jgi:hypothetical protein